MVLNRRRQYHDPTNGQGGENEALLDDRSKESTNTPFDGNITSASTSSGSFATKAIVFNQSEADYNSKNSVSKNPMIRRIELPDQSKPLSFSSSQPFEQFQPQDCNNLRSTRTAVTVELQRIQPSTPNEFVYYTVQPGDTLHNLSVRYSCPVASIKRLNNLWSDQEFYGLSRIKLPVGKFRLIADAIHQDQSKNPIVAGSSRHYDPIPNTSIDSMPIPGKSLNEITGLSENYADEMRKTFEPADHSSGFVFRDLDLNIAKAKSAAHSYRDNANAIFQSLAESGNIVCDDEELDDNINKIAQREAETLLNDMSDYGLSYSGLILFIFIVCLICPLSYVIYLEETHHDRMRHSD